MDSNRKENPPTKLSWYRRTSNSRSEWKIKRSRLLSSSNDAPIIDGSQPSSSQPQSYATPSMLLPSPPLQFQPVLLEESGAKLLAETLEINSTLRYLDIRDHNIGAKGLNSLKNAMISSQTLTYLNLESHEKKLKYD